MQNSIKILKCEDSRYIRENMAVFQYFAYCSREVVLLSHNSWWARIFANISLNTTKSADNAANSFGGMHSESLQAIVER